MGRFGRLTVILAVLLPTVVGRAQGAEPPHVAAAQHGMVVTAQHLASEIGANILKAGGNAVDAAVAVGYAEAVVNPCCGNIGGGGFMVLRLADGRTRFIDFRETAPAAATADMYLDRAGKVIPGQSLFGWKAVAVPGTVLGMGTALREYGTLSRQAVMAPAIRLAQDGFVLTTGDAAILDAKAAKFRADPILARIFLHPDGTPLHAGDRLTQTDLARTLQAIADDGPDAFYKGRIPDAVAAASHADGGILTPTDFAQYRVTESAPLRCTYRGYVFLSAPPPSSGGATMCEILNILEGYDMQKLGFHSAQATHVMVEAMRHAYLDRNLDLGDPAFVHNPLDRLLSKDYAAAIRVTIRPNEATPSTTLPMPTSAERIQTTHYSIVDGKGNAVAVTYTINGLFGALVMAPGTGFLLNDEMDDFTSKPGVANMFGLVQGEANAIAPGKRPLSSMAPTIVLRPGSGGDRLFLVLGSPGGSRIITITLETAINVIDYGMVPEQAVDAPRIHHQWLPDVVFAEPGAIAPDALTTLQRMGYTVKTEPPWGAAQLIEVAPDTEAAAAGLKPGWLYGASDDRRPAGGAVGD